MKIELQADELLSCVSEVAKVINGKISIGVMNGVRITSTASTVTVSASNMEQWLSCEMPVEAAQPGDYVASPRLLTAALASMGKAKIEVTCDGKKLTIKEGKNVANIPVIDPKGWVEVPSSQTFVPVLQLTAPVVADMMWVAKAVCTDGTRINISGVHVSPRDGMIAASDGKRAHCAEVAVTDAPSLTIPNDTLGRLREIAGKAESPMLEVSQSMMRIVAGGWTFVSKVIDTNWPLATLKRMMVWNGLKNTAKMSRDQMLACIKSVTAFDTEFSAIGITCEALGVRVTCASNDGDVERWVDGGGSCEFRVSGKLMSELISGGGEEIEIRNEDKDSPIAMKCGGRHGVVMPMKLNK